MPSGSKVYQFHFISFHFIYGALLCILLSINALTITTLLKTYNITILKKYIYVKIIIIIIIIITIIIIIIMNKAAAAAESFLATLAQCLI